ncbi:phosphodiesterase [Olsenella sp. YH-ols2217]|uniref:Phosphoesterase n=1 Tax=Kribbibacterium absianum TaxID=3044210 RepID=A0ABT6ZKA5_9ACTN|nr:MULTISPECIES: phosphodiesterase [unclassified Olsenella]MDJ1122555.1 phosphodiesterase [Olsenella sp. YH-ols2216]MDJ1129485.1 phosphodiesterase [Olsenella sp. YH-ols2217]
MKFVIASDIHGSAYWCERLMEEVDREQPDRLLLLGDILYHGPRNDLPRDYAPKKVIELLSPWADRIVCVRGNCEAEVDQMVLPFPCLADFAQVFDDQGNGLYLTHGHLWGPGKLPPLPAGTLFLYGHTHVKDDHDENGVRVFNPGSVSIPKDGSHSYAVYEDGKLEARVLDTR